MIKKTITYKDVFTDAEISEDFYFHLSKADLIEMEVSHPGGSLHDHLRKVIDTKNGRAILDVFKDIILKAYGQRSEDGRSFRKSKEAAEDFLHSEAYSNLLMEICTDAQAATEFITGIMPSGLDAEVAALNPEDSNGAKPEPRVLTQAEIVEMSASELHEGLSTGKYKLSPLDKGA